MSGVPERISGYRLLEELGRGGMGAVYLGQHEETGARRAIKLLRPGLDPELVLRFRREGEALARIGGHPNVVRVHAAGEQDGFLFLVMDLAEGGSLQQRLQREPLPPEEARGIVVALARGLAHAHAHGVLHRDLKPDNVLFDEHGTPQLTDFGLARIEDAGTLTETGTVMGTPVYMAPEQVEASPNLDARTDVYGLGAILYQCLTGQPPFAPGPAMAVLAQVLHQDPPAPRALQEGIPSDLEAVCLRALAKRPQARFPDAAAFASALTGEPASRTGRPLALVAGLVVLSVLVIAVFARSVGSDAQGERERPRAAKAEPAKTVADAPAPQPARVVDWDARLRSARTLVATEPARALRTLEGFDPASGSPALVAGLIKRVRHELDRARSGFTRTGPAQRDVLERVIYLHRLQKQLQPGHTAGHLLQLVGALTHGGRGTPPDVLLALGEVLPDSRERALLRIAATYTRLDLPTRKRFAARYARLAGRAVAQAQADVNRAPRFKAQLLRCRMLLEAGDPSGCAREATGMLAWKGLGDPQRFDALLLRARARLALGSPAELRGAMFDLNRVGSRRLEVRYHSARILWTMNRRVEALREAEAFARGAKTDHPLFPRAVAWVWHYAWTLGRADRAQAAVRRLMDTKDRDWAWVGWWVRYAWIELQTKQTERARKHLVYCARYLGERGSRLGWLEGEVQALVRQNDLEPGLKAVIHRLERRWPAGEPVPPPEKRP